MPPPIYSPFVIDISHWIEIDDFTAITPKPWLVLTKATEGTSFIDAKVGEYADEIRDAGYRLGLYHFMRPGDEIAQAEFFCEIIQTIGLRGNEVLACDLEVDGITLEQSRRFMDRVESLTGMECILYSTQLMLESLYTTPNVPPMWLKGVWMWIAEYATPPADGSIPDWIVPKGLNKSKIAMHQYTDDGEVQGIPNNNVDLNTISPQYVSHIGLTEPMEGESMRYQMTTISNGTRIRADHNTGAAILTWGNGQNGVAANVTVEGDELFTATQPLTNTSGVVYQKPNDKWLKIVYQGVTGWMAYIHMGSPICDEFVDNGATPPPAEGATIILNEKDGTVRRFEEVL